MVALLLLSSALAQEVPALPPPPTEKATEKLTLDGYLRTRGALFYNLDLDRGPTPSTGQPVFPISPDDGETLRSSDLRLRVDATLAIVPDVKIHARIDGLDDVVLGSTPQGLPVDRWAPSAYATTTQEPAQGGLNGTTDSLVLKRAWGEALTPVGAFLVGRMGMPAWGLGMVANPGDDLDDDFDEDVDRLGFATTVFDHLVGCSYDWNAVGPTSASASGSLWGQDLDLTDADDVRTVSATVLRYLDPAATQRRVDTGRPVFTWGTWITWRTQEADVPSYWLDGWSAFDGELSEEDLVERGFRTFGADLYLSLRGERYSVAAEAALFSGSVSNASLVPGVQMDAVTMNQAGALLQAAWLPVPDRLKIGLDAGYASGDSAPGFGVAPPVDQVTAQPGDMDGPQFSLPEDATVDNFRFHPNTNPDLILWRQIVGTFTDGVFLKPSVLYSPHPRLDLGAALVVSQALYASSTPGGSKTLGSEVDLLADWRIWEGFEARVQYGILLPGEGLQNTALHLSPTPAQTLRGLVAFRY